MTIYSNFFLHLFFTSKIYTNTFKIKIGIGKHGFFEMQAFKQTAYFKSQKIRILCLTSIPFIYIYPEQLYKEWYACP